MDGRELGRNGRIEMQQRMKLYSMNEAQIGSLLKRALVGRLSVNAPDGFPYTVPVHFVYLDGRVYIHGLLKGQKLDYLQKDNRVCFEADRLEALLTEHIEAACKADSAYESVIMTGRAAVIEDETRKALVLHAFAEKYVPRLAEAAMQAAQVRATAVIEVVPDRVTGKYHKG